MLKLQTGVKGGNKSISNDELHFILVHQNFELWFKLIINELRSTRDILASDYVEETKLPQAVHHMNRVIETFNLMAQQWKVMETLEPQDFLNFRDELGPASGFESFQMREMGRGNQILSLIYRTVYPQSFGLRKGLTEIVRMPPPQRPLLLPWLQLMLLARVTLLVWSPQTEERSLVRYRE